MSTTFGTTDSTRYAPSPAPTPPKFSSYSPKNAISKTRLTPPLANDSTNINTRLILASQTNNILRPPTPPLILIDNTTNNVGTVVRNIESYSSVSEKSEGEPVAVVAVPTEEPVAVAVVPTEEPVAIPVTVPFSLSSSPPLKPSQLSSSAPLPSPPIHNIPSNRRFSVQNISSNSPKLTVITSNPLRPRANSSAVSSLASPIPTPSPRPRSNSRISGRMTKLKSFLFLGDKTPTSATATPLSTPTPTPTPSHVTTGTTTPHPDMKNAVITEDTLLTVNNNQTSPASSTVSIASFTYPGAGATGATGTGTGTVTSTVTNTVTNATNTVTNTATSTTTSTLTNTVTNTASTGSTVTSNTAPSRSSSISKSTVIPRFQLSEDGTTHTHHLKTAKRQEKLSGMIKEFLGGKKLRDEAVSAVYAILNGNNQLSQTQQMQIKQQVQTQQQAQSQLLPPQSSQSPQPPQQPQSPPPTQAQPPSLMAGFVNQLKRGDKEAQSLLSSGTATPTTQSFVEKYGKCHEIIGKGSFGIVRVAHKIDPKNQRDQLFAVKEFKRRPQESEQKYSKRLTSEFCISSSLHHPNIIQTLDLLQDAKGEYCEVMEYCSGGDLYSLILVVGKLEYLEADCFFKQIIRGVNYMHEMGVAHRDLKPENILLTANGSVKITDFGNGECFRMAWERAIHLSNGLCGSAPYIAPEEFTDSEFDPRRLDIWAIGVIYMAMRTGRHLWRMAKPNEDEFYAKYLQGRKDENGYEPIEGLKRARCRNVIYSILDPVPSRRITGKQILKSEWGREIHVCQAGELGL